MQPEEEKQAKKPGAAPPSPPAVEAREVVYRRGGHTILNGVSLAVPRGECFGVFGTRGTGKTSLLHLLAGVEKCTGGRVQTRGRIGLVTQERSLFQDLNVGENLDYIATLKGCAREEPAVVATRLELDAHLTQPVRPLPAGIYQRLSMACALLGAPAILIVDELINDVDLPSRSIIVRELRAFLAAGGTCLWGFSDSAYFPQMDRVGWLEDGQLTIYDSQAAAGRWRRAMRDLHAARGENDA